VKAAPGPPRSTPGIGWASRRRRRPSPRSGAGATTPDNRTSLQFVNGSNRLTFPVDRAYSLAE